MPEPAERLPRPSAAADESGAAEHMLLGALETLYADASEADAQLGILRVVLLLLQRHGGVCRHASPACARSLRDDTLGGAPCLVVMGRMCSSG